MSTITMAAVAAHFGRDIERSLVKLPGMIASAQERGIDLLVLPDATLGGYLLDMHHPGPDDLPQAVEVDGPEVAAVAAMAGDTTVCFGIAERALEGLNNADASDEADIRDEFATYFEAVA